MILELILTISSAFFFLGEERNFCTLVRDVYTVLKPVCRASWFPHSLEVEVRTKMLLRI